MIIIRSKGDLIALRRAEQGMESLCRSSCPANVDRNEKKKEIDYKLTDCYILI
jgi:hypothetical protein